jgi:hypothetical protein
MPVSAERQTALRTSWPPPSSCVPSISMSVSVFHRRFETRKLYSEAPLLELEAILYSERCGGSPRWQDVLVGRRKNEDGKRGDCAINGCDVRDIVRASQLSSTKKFPVPPTQYHGICSHSGWYDWSLLIEAEPTAVAKSVSFARGQTFTANGTFWMFR